VIFSEKHLESPPLILSDNPIKQATVHKHLGLLLTFNLDWSQQIHSVCLRANRKLAVLRSIYFIQRRTLDMLYKVTIRSVIEYALIVYYHNLRGAEKNRLEQIQYKAAKLITGALHLTSKEKLNSELGWETIESRANFLGLSLFHKIKLGETRPLILKCMPALAPPIRHELRKRRPHIRYPAGKVGFSKSFFPNFTKKWENLPQKFMGLQIDEFKKLWKLDFAPSRYKYLSRGSKLGNKLLTRIRVGRSFLKSHSFSIGLADTPYCSCDNTTTESSLHYFIYCPLYTEERQTMINTFKHFIRTFSNFPKAKQLETILFGIDKDNPEIFTTNVSLQYAVQKFILQTKRFN
jgi:hypothetical protein